MIFEQLNSNSCKTYLIVNEKSAVLVDPLMAHFQDYLTLLKEQAFTLTHVIDTHTHADHLSASASLKDAANCEYIMHKNAPSKCVTLRVEDGDILTLNGIEFKFLYTPGHTNDSIGIIVDNKFLTGDLLFFEDIEADQEDISRGSGEEHWESLKKLKDLPDDMMIYPAHGGDDHEPAPLSQHKEAKEHLQNRSKEDFVKYMDNLKLNSSEKLNRELNANEIEVDYIEPKALEQRLQEEPQQMVLIDVREVKELIRDGQIEGVINIPIGSLEQQQNDLKEFEDKDLIVVCRSGARATTGGQILKKAGYKNVYVLNGGMLAWEKLKLS